MEIRSQVSSFSRTISFSFSEKLSDIVGSIRNESFFSSASDKENLIPINQERIKIEEIIDKQVYEDLSLEYEVGVNVISHNTIQIFNEIPILLTLRNNYGRNHNSNSIEFSLANSVSDPSEFQFGLTNPKPMENPNSFEFGIDMIIILNLQKNSNSILKSKNNILSIFNYILSKFSGNDRLGVIVSGSSEGDASILQSFGTLSKNMMKLLIQFIGCITLKEGNSNIFKALNIATEMLKKRNYRNDFTTIIVISDFLFSEGKHEHYMIEKEMKSFEKKLQDSYCNFDDLFNINILYFGSVPLDCLLFESLSLNNKGKFYRTRKLSFLKVKTNKKI